MSEYKLAKVKGGRFGFAKVEVRATKHAGYSQVVQALANNVHEAEGEVNMASEPSWVLAAIEGASEALTVAERPGRVTDHFMVEIDQSR